MKITVAEFVKQNSRLRKFIYEIHGCEKYLGHRCPDTRMTGGEVMVRLIGREKEMGELESFL